MKLKCSLYHPYPLSLMIPYDFVLFDLDMHIYDLSLEQLLKTYSSHRVLQNSILDLWTTSSSYTHYQSLSLNNFLGNSRVSEIPSCGEHYRSFMKKID